MIAAYVSGGGSLLMDLLPAMGDKDTMNKIAVLVFTIFFGSFIVIGTHSVDKINRVLFFVMIAAFILVLALMLPNIKFDNLMAMPIDNALIISASPVFFTAFGFHGSIPSLNKYLDGNVKSLRIAIFSGFWHHVICLLFMAAFYARLTQPKMSFYKFCVKTPR